MRMNECRMKTFCIFFVIKPFHISGSQIIFTVGGWFACACSNCMYIVQIVEYENFCAIRVYYSKRTCRGQYKKTYTNTWPAVSPKSYCV